MPKGSNFWLCIENTRTCIILGKLNLWALRYLIWIFNPLEAVPRYHDSQLQVGENYSYLFIWDTTFANFDV